MSNDKAFNEHLTAITKGSLEKIKDSEVFMSMLTENAMTAPEVLLQMGIAVLHDKPIGILAFEGSKVSETLKRIAFGIEYVPKYASGKEMHEATKRLLEKAPK